MGPPAARSSRRWTRFPSSPEGSIPEFDERPPGDDPNDPLRRPVEGDVLPQEVFERPGLDILRDLIAGDLPRPPIHHLTGLRLVGAEEGETVVELPCSKWLSTSAGTVQGGFTAMLAESAMTACRLQHRAGRYGGRDTRLQGQLPAAGLPRRQGHDGPGAHPAPGTHPRRRRGRADQRRGQAGRSRHRLVDVPAGPARRTWSASSSARAHPIPRTIREPSDTVGPWASSAS